MEALPPEGRDALRQLAHLCTWVYVCLGPVSSHTCVHVWVYVCLGRAICRCVRYVCVCVFVCVCVCVWVGGYT